MTHSLLRSTLDLHNDHSRWRSAIFFFFFFNDTATTEIYTLSLHDALPISPGRLCGPESGAARALRVSMPWLTKPPERSEEHTSELQSRLHLVCRLLLEKKKKNSDRVVRPLHVRSRLELLLCDMSQTSLPRS